MCEFFVLIFSKLETKLRIELEELKLRSEKEYNQEVLQFTKELDGVRMRHIKDLEELVSYLIATYSPFHVLIYSVFVLIF